MAESGDEKRGAGGIRRLVDAFGYSIAGIRHALRHEASIRQEIVLLAILAPVSAFLPVSRIEHLLLVLTMLVVGLVEFINSAIESAVDRISLEHHPLAGRAKDLGSAAVLVSLAMWAMTWAVIVGPIALQFLRRP